MRTHSLLMTLLFVFTLAGCASPTSAIQTAYFDIRGEWEYTMVGTDGNTYDFGTMTFRGEPSAGTYLQVNIYTIEYIGEFSVNRETLKLTGYETWEGEFSDSGTIKGIWKHDDGNSGVFTASRK